jgi:hypothetical protein
MMLSMLICYLQMVQKDIDKKMGGSRRQSIGRQSSKGGDGTEGVTITNVYRVALDVMLQRVQSKQQADRHSKDDKVEACKKMLEKLAMTMHVRQRLEIDVAEVDKMFSIGAHKEDWRALKTSVQSGHAMFLRMFNEHGKLELRFLVKGFQNFFAACDIAHGGGGDLPAIVPLLTESWWVQMIEILAE